MKNTYGLALGGGAARGLVHIGVLKYFEENNIKISEISGTSMGAVIGALFASGKTSNEIIKISKELNFFKLIDFGLSFGLIKGKKVVKKLEEIFGELKIEDLDIDLKIVATNLETGEREIFTSGKIVDALRASISLPGVFIPYEIGDKTYIDGGITNNLPVDVLTLKNIIGVSALKKVTGKLEKKKKFLFFNFNKSFIDYNYGVLHRTILLMMKQNEDKSIKNCKKGTLIITPDFGNLDYYSFDKVDDFVKLGFKEAKNKIVFL